jgi:hypothetical protein
LEIIFDKEKEEIFLACSLLTDVNYLKVPVLEDRYHEIYEKT